MIPGGGDPSLPKVQILVSLEIDRISDIFRAYGGLESAILWALMSCIVLPRRARKFEVLVSFECISAFL